MIIYTSDLEKTKKELTSTYKLSDFNIKNIAMGHRVHLKGSKGMYGLKIRQLKDASEYCVEFNKE